VDLVKIQYARDNEVTTFLPDTPDAIRQRGAIFRFSLTDNFDPGLSFLNI
jgi:hypothetical protein